MLIVMLIRTAWRPDSAVAPRRPDCPLMGVYEQLVEKMLEV